MIMKRNSNIERVVLEKKRRPKKDKNIKKGGRRGKMINKKKIMIKKMNITLRVGGEKGR
jgi:hypothetical protein